MKRIWLIFVREYLENVRTKAFLIGIVLTPLWFGMVFLIPMLGGGSKVDRVVIVDETGLLATKLVEALEETRGFEPEIHEDPESAWQSVGGLPSYVDLLRLEAAQGKLFAVLLTEDVLEKREGTAGRQSGVVGANSVGSLQTGAQIASIVDDLVNQNLVQERQIDPAIADMLSRKAVRYTGLTPSGEEGPALQAVTPLIFMLMLFMGIVGISQMLISSTIEEKASRVYELLLSSVSPFQLMTGKILGICAVGFTLLALWSGGGLLAASLNDYSGIVTGGQIGWFITYYLLGFLLISSLMVAVGSACNTLKEAQNMMAPLSLLLALPLLLSMVVLKNPNGTFATFASFFPPFTPFLMMARIADVPGPPTWQIWASLAVLVVSTWLAIRLAARVFRTGILMYGQPPSLKEIWRWMWEP